MEHGYGNIWNLTFDKKLFLSVEKEWVCLNGVDTLTNHLVKKKKSPFYSSIKINQDDLNISFKIGDIKVFLLKKD